MKSHVRGSLREAGQLQLMLCWLCEGDAAVGKPAASTAAPPATNFAALAEAAHAAAADASTHEVESVTVLPAGAVYAAPRDGPACCGCWTVLARLFQRQGDAPSVPATASC